MTDFDVLLEEKVRRGGRAVEQVGKIVEVAAAVAEHDACATRAAQLLHDDRKAQLALDEVNVGREFAEDGFRDWQLRTGQYLERVELVGYGLDRRRAVGDGDALALEVAQHSECEIGGLTATARDDHVRLVKLASLINRRPAMVGVHHEVEFAWLQNLQFDVERGGGFLKTSHFVGFGHIRPEVSIEKEPAAHGVPLDKRVRRLRGAPCVCSRRSAVCLANVTVRSRAIRAAKATLGSWLRCVFAPSTQNVRDEAISRISDVCVRERDYRRWPPQLARRGRASIPLGGAAWRALLLDHALRRCARGCGDIGAWRPSFAPAKSGSVLGD